MTTVKEMPAIKVLVADDHPVFRRGVLAILKEYPEFAVVGQAVDGIDAVAKALELRPDIVVMDVRMPRSNGVEATATLRQALPDTKVFALTVSDKDEDLFAAMEAGARGYLLKSADLDELISAIKLVAAGDVIISPIMASRIIQQIAHKSKPKDEEAMGLSTRELEVLELVAHGDSNKGIASKLFISETTVKAHLRAILDKLHVKNRAQAVAQATAWGVLRAH